MKTFTIFAILVVVLALTLAAPQRASRGRGKAAKCSKERLAKVEQCALVSQYIGDYDMKPPSNDAEMTNFCKDKQEAITCVKDYAKDCMKRFHAQMIGTVMSQTSKLFRGICRSRSQREDYMHHFQCMKDKNAGKIHDCMNGLIKKIEWTSNYEKLNTDYSVPSFCCLMPSYRKCVISRSEQICKGKTRDSEETGELMNELFSGMVGEAVDLYCGRFTNEKTCREKLPDIMEAYDKIDAELASGNFTKPKAKAYILPVADVFSRE